MTDSSECQHSPKLPIWKACSVKQPSLPQPNSQQECLVEWNRFINFLQQLKLHLCVFLSCDNYIIGSKMKKNVFFFGKTFSSLFHHTQCYIPCTTTTSTPTPIQLPSAKQHFHICGFPLFLSFSRTLTSHVYRHKYIYRILVYYVGTIQQPSFSKRKLPQTIRNE